jgi:hypothetical protein
VVSLDTNYGSSAHLVDLDNGVVVAMRICDGLSNTWSPSAPKRVPRHCCGLVLSLCDSHRDYRVIGLQDRRPL